MTQWISIKKSLMMTSSCSDKKSKSFKEG